MISYFAKFSVNLGQCSPSDMTTVFSASLCMISALSGSVQPQNLAMLQQLLSSASQGQQMPNLGNTGQLPWQKEP